MDETKMAIEAARAADWDQVVLNGGPPCFHLEGQFFCLRAEGWEGHGTLHAYLPLDGLLRETRAKALEEAARAVCFECRHGFAPWLEDGNWLHGENNRCHAQAVRALKG